MITENLQPLDGGCLGGKKDDGDGDDGGGGGGGGGHLDHVLFSVLSLSPSLHWSVVSHCHHSTGGGPRVAGSLSVQTAAHTETLSSVATCHILIYKEREATRVIGLDFKQSGILFSGYLGENDLDSDLRNYYKHQALIGVSSC